MSTITDGLPPWPVDDFTRYGATEPRKLGNVQRFVGTSLSRNWLSIPHVTHHDVADITAVEKWRKAKADVGPKLTLVPILVRLLADALAAFPQFNASLDPSGQTLVMKSYVNIGVAVDTPRGLMVPVVRDCDRKTLGEIRDELAAVSARARARGLSIEDMAGGCMTLSSLGHIGGTFFTPIVNAPELAILGVGARQIVAQPDADGGVAWREHLPLSLSYDHRVINGVDAARFVRFVAQGLADVAVDRDVEKKGQGS